MAKHTRDWGPEELGAGDYGKFPGGGTFLTEALRLGRRWGTLKRTKFRGASRVPMLS